MKVLPLLFVLPLCLPAARAQGPDVPLAFVEATPPVKDAYLAELIRTAEDARVPKQLREDVLDELGRALPGDDAPAVAAALGRLAQNPQLFRPALKALAELGRAGYGNVAAPEILRQTQSADPAVALYALGRLEWTMGELKGPVRDLALSSILPLAASAPDKELRANAIFALRWFTDQPSASTALRQHVADPAWRLRAYAAWALISHRASDAELLPVVEDLGRRAASEPAHADRRQAGFLLKQFGAQGSDVVARRAVDGLLPLLQDAHQPNREVALVFLSWPGVAERAGAAIEPLRTAANAETDTALRLKILRALRDIQAVAARG